MTQLRLSTQPKFKVGDVVYSLMSDEEWRNVPDKVIRMTWYANNYFYFLEKGRHWASQDILTAHRSDQK